MNRFAVKRSLCRLMFVFGFSVAAMCPALSFAAKPALFGPPTRYAVGSFPGAFSIAVVAQDFNGDGWTDLASANGSSDISILLGNGHGSFGAATNFGLTAGTGITSSIASGDFNRDGNVDLVVTSLNFFTQEGLVSVLLGHGDGSFGPASDFAIGGFNPTSVGVADLNHDGKLDLAVTASNGDGSIPFVSILLGDGNGSFGAPAQFLVGSDPKSVVIGDFNHDGKLDLAIANNLSDNVSILLGDGTGNFNTATNFLVGSPGPTSIATGDFNGDGNLDLAVANSGSGIGSTVSILMGDGTGAFGPPTDFVVGSSGSAQPYSVAVGDLNCDGKLDLAVANVNETNVSVLIGTGTGTFDVALNFLVGNQGSGPISVAIADFNGDGKQDLATADYSEDFVSVLLNTAKKKCKTHGAHDEDEP